VSEADWFLAIEIFAMIDFPVLPAD